ncbi:hypothetical protein NQZ68_001756 [Dissostichus eleginoides]|nr:hypothetical protein NQZ68_001756 [Dissostichus eleginoides]
MFSCILCLASPSASRRQKKKRGSGNISTISIRQREGGREQTPLIDTHTHSQHTHTQTLDISALVEEVSSPRQLPGRSHNSVGLWHRASPSSQHQGFAVVFPRSLAPSAPPGSFGWS